MNKILEYILNFKFKDNVSDKVKDIGKSVDDVGQKFSDTSEKASKSADKVIRKTNSISSSIGNLCEKLNSIRLNAIIDNFKNVSDSFEKLTSNGISFQQSMADLSSITGITGKDLEDLGRVARETGKESGLGATGAADAFALLASQIQIDKIGMSGLKILQKETITLAHAAGMEMSDAATAMAATINQFGLKATEANRVINVLAAGSKYGAAEIVDLAQSFKVSGAVAASAGLSVEQAAGAIEVLSKSNLKGAEAGTALRNILLKMQTVLNVDFSKTGFGTALDALKPKLNDVTFLSKTFGMENIAAAQFLITNAHAVDEMTQAVTGTNVAEEQAAIRTNTTEEAMKRMQAKIDDIKISAFNLTGGFAAYVSACGDSVVMASQMIPLMSLLRKGFISLTTQINFANIASKSFAAVQALVNAIMSANPIAMIVIAIGALVAGLILAYNHCESFRKIVDKAWTAIKQFATVIWNNLCKAFDWLATVIGKVWDKLKALFGIKDKNTESAKKLSNQTTQLAQVNESAATSVDSLTGSLSKQGNQINVNTATIGGMENKINELRKKQSAANTEQAIALEKEINLWEKKKKTMENAVLVGASARPSNVTLSGDSINGMNITNPVVDKKNEKINLPDSSALQSISNGFIEASKNVQTFTESIFGSDSVIGQFADNATSGIRQTIKIFNEFGKMMKNSTLNTVQKVSGGLDTMGALMSSMSGIVGQSAGNWLSWGANLLAVISSAIPQLLVLFGIQSAVGVATQAKLGFPYNIIAMAATVAGIAAAVAAIPKPKALANGALAYGNAIVQVGEYAGASNNPEVIAPLNKLRGMINPSGTENMVLETKVRGKDLYVALKKVEYENSRIR